MTPAYLALGSNLNNPAKQLRDAVSELSAVPHCQLEAVSSAYRSAAVGPAGQPDYLNAVLKLFTDLTARQLLETCQAIETAHGRIRSEHWGARTLDIDILLFGTSTISSPELRIPHPRIAQRNFVLYPLAEIADRQMMLPSMGVLESLLANCPRGDLTRTQVPLRGHIDSD